MRNAVLSTYRALLLQSEMLSSAQKRSETQALIKKTFRENAQLKDEEEILQKLQIAKDRLSFLRMITPKRPQSSSRVNQQKRDALSSSPSGTTTYVIRDGKAIAVDELYRSDTEKEEKARYSNWGMGNVDPDLLAKHEYLNRRMQFKEGPLKDKPKRMREYAMNRITSKTRPG